MASSSPDRATRRVIHARRLSFPTPQHDLSLVDGAVASDFASKRGSEGEGEAGRLSHEQAENRYTQLTNKRGGAADTARPTVNRNEVG